MKRKSATPDSIRFPERVKKFAQIVIENERFVSRYRLPLVRCKLLVHVMSVAESEKSIKKAEKPYEMDD